METMGVRIMQALDARGMKQSDLVRITGIGKSSISTYISGEYEPKRRNIYKIAAALGVSESWLMGYNVPMNMKAKQPATDADRTPSTEAQRIATQYDLATDHEKSIVRATLAPYADKVKAYNEEYSSEVVPQLTPLPLYSQSVAAGLGNYLDDDSYELVEFPHVPAAAKIALRVSGDSMEPMYSDGDIVFVETDSILQDGEVGVFNYDGNALLKKLRLNPPRLVSLNPGYDDIALNEEMKFFTIGRVVGVVGVAE